MSALVKVCLDVTGCVVTQVTRIEHSQEPYPGTTDTLFNIQTLKDMLTICKENWDHIIMFQMNEGNKRRNTQRFEED